MRKFILLFSFTLFFVGTAFSQELVDNELVVEYNKVKAETYLQKILEERESLDRARDYKAMIRDRESAKIYCKVDLKVGCETY